MIQQTTSISPVDDDFIHDAVESAGINALRMALYQVTGDPDLATMKISKEKIRGGVLFDYVLGDAEKEIVKAKAREFLKKATPTTISPPPSYEETRKFINLFAGKIIEDNEAVSSYEELAFEDFPRGVRWTEKPPMQKLAKHKVIVIGAGLSGIATAIQLKLLGIPFTVIERQEGVGGTWLLNTYPECRVDTLSYLFQYRFEKNYHWTEYFAPRQETQKYLEHVCAKYGIYEHFQFNKEVVAAIWEESSSTWRLQVKKKETGEVEAYVANSIVSASGLFATPKRPNIPGIQTFKKPMFHTTEWDHAFDYADKRVAVIGTGSTGTQLTPGLAKYAKSVTVYQRTANWIVSYEGYKSKVQDHMRWLCDTMPYYWNWYCYAAYFRSLDLAALQVRDKDFETKAGQVNERNKSVRETLTNFIQDKMHDRPDLVAKLIPTHPPLVRRLVVDNGFYDALKEPHVELVTDNIDRITPNGILTVDGKEREFDGIVLSAGFETGQYFFPIDYKGVGGTTLSSLWSKDGARAYLGMVMPGFPNLFSLYGPNHQPRGGSLYSWAEIWARYAVSAIVWMIENDAKSMTVKSTVNDAYQEELDKRNATLIWESDGAGYYVNNFGRQGVNMPWITSEYHAMVVKPKPEDFKVMYRDSDLDGNLKGGRDRYVNLGKVDEVDSPRIGPKMSSNMSVDEHPVLL